MFDALAIPDIDANSVVCGEFLFVYAWSSGALSQFDLHGGLKTE